MEFAVLSVDPTGIPDIMRECVNKGVKAALIISDMLEEGALSDGEFQKMMKSLWEQEMENVSLLREKVDALKKPVMYVNPMPRIMAEPESFSLLREKGIPIYSNPGRAANVLGHLVRYSEFLRRVN